MMAYVARVCSRFTDTYIGQAAIGELRLALCKQGPNKCSFIVVVLVDTTVSIIESILHGLKFQSCLKHQLHRVYYVGAS